MLVECPLFTKRKKLCPCFRKTKSFYPKLTSYRNGDQRYTTRDPPISWGSGAQRWGDTLGHRQFLFLRPAPTPVPQLSWLQSIIFLGAHLHSGGSSPEGSHRQV